MTLEETIARNRRITTHLMIAAVVTLGVALGLIIHSIYQLCQ